MWAALADYLKPGVVVNFLGFAGAITAFIITSRRSRTLQQRTNYLALELESSRIFHVCFENPNMPRYLNGDLPDRDLDDEMREKAYWLLPQILNVFEIIISFRKEGMISKDVFDTWVAWFHEVGTYPRFAEAWHDRQLRLNYKAELRTIMDKAHDLRAAFGPNYGSAYALAQFYRDVADVLHEPSISRFFSSATSGAVKA